MKLEVIAEHVVSHQIFVGSSHRCSMYVFMDFIDAQVLLVYEFLSIQSSV